MSGQVYLLFLCFISPDLILEAAAQTEDDTLLLSIRRSRWTNRQLLKHFRDMLLEPPLPLSPHDVEVPPEVSALEADLDSTSAALVTGGNQSPSLEDPAAQSAQLPLMQRAVLTTSKKNSFGVFHLYDEGSIPSVNDPEDQSWADPLPPP